MPRLIRIQRHDNLAGEARRDKPNLPLGHRRAHLRHHVEIARLMRLNDIQVAFDNHRRSTIANGAFAHIQAEQQAALVEQRGLRRIDVLGAVVLAKRATAKTDNPPALITDRNHQAIAEAIIDAPLVAAHGQANFNDIFIAITEAAQRKKQPIPAIGRVSQLKDSNGFIL